MKNWIFNLVTAGISFTTLRSFAIIYGCIYYKLQINSFELLEYLSASLFIKRRLKYTGRCGLQKVTDLRKKSSIQPFFICKLKFRIELIKIQQGTNK